MPVKTATATLTDHLAQAERGVIKPRERVADRRQALDDAVLAGDFTTAATLKGELAEASASLALAEASVAALRDGQASVVADRAKADRTVAEAQAKAESGRVIANGLEGEKRGLTGVAEERGRMFEHLAAAASAFRAMKAWEYRTGEQRNRIIAARVQAGDVEAPGPVAPRPNTSDALVDSDPLIAALARWAP
jgi:hypothetical protein